jgi:tRNA A-37 threonylcarbamoyl transferase component Bud32
MSEDENIIQGYSIYKLREGIPQEYQKYHIFVKKEMKDENISCQIGCDPIGALSNVAEIFPVCLSCNDKKYIGKVIPYSVTPHRQKGIIDEINIQNKANQERLAPEIIMYFLGEEKAVIIMDKIEGNTINSKLIDIIDKAKAQKETKDQGDADTDAKAKILEIYNSVKESLDFLHQKDIYHGDSHLENFMYDTQQKDKIWIIDFGHSSIDVGTKNVKILEDYMCLRTAFTILSKSKTKKGSKFILKGYSIYLEDIIKRLNEKILELEKNVCVPCVASTSVQLSMRRSNRKVSKRKLSKRKVSKRQLSKRQVSKRKVSERQLSKRKVSKRKVSKRSRR